jgi:hypothetical protein
MDNEELNKVIQQLKDENEKLKNELLETKEHLKKYTAPARHKTYYENHKLELLAKNKEYKVPPEKKKEYARTAYLNKKEKEKMKNL